MKHHKDLVRLFLEHAPSTWNLRGKHVCEVGCGDCLALAGLAVGLGAAQVDLVEPTPARVNELQAGILRSIKEAGYQLDTTILKNGHEYSLDNARIQYRQAFMHEIQVRDAYDYLFSHHVMEHVEDLDSFYAACFEAMKTGGQMFHCIDFSGHAELEDPVPPLDFQTYPDWLYSLMCPPFYRATRYFLGDHQRAMRKAGFTLEPLRVTWRADEKYMAEIRPRLRPAAQAIDAEELGVLEAVVVAHKKPR